MWSITFSTSRQIQGYFPRAGLAWTVLRRGDKGLGYSCTVYSSPKVRLHPFFSVKTGQTGLRCGEAGAYHGPVLAEAEAARQEGVMASFSESLRRCERDVKNKGQELAEAQELMRKKVSWAANKGFEISKF